MNSERSAATGPVVALGLAAQYVQAAGADVGPELTGPLGRIVLGEPPTETRQVFLS
jgi:hypothetical protein